MSCWACWPGSPTFWSGVVKAPLTFAGRRSAGLPGPEPRARRAHRPRGGWRSDARTGESEHNAVEVNPPDDRLDRAGTPARREEIDAPFRALLERLGEVYLRPTRAQVDERNSQPGVARFKYDRLQTDLARIAAQVRCLSFCRVSAGLGSNHDGRREADIVPAQYPLSGWEFSRRAISALSTGLPNIGLAMPDQARVAGSSAVSSSRRRVERRDNFGHDQFEGDKLLRASLGYSGIGG
jgi:hypothetical protein